MKQVTMSSNIQKSQTGMVSIMIVMIMMIVITLIVLGFAGVSRRNSREAVDRELSSQAFYAAETGVNDVLTAVKGGTLDLDTNPAYATSCTALITALGSNNQLNGNGVAYTCLLANDKPTSIQSTVTLNSSQVIPLILSVANNGKLEFSWPASGTGSVANCPATGSVDAFSPASNWSATTGCPFGVLRVDIYQDNGVYNAAAMAANTATVFMVPSRAGGAPSLNINFGNPQQSVYTVNAACSSGTSCSVELGGLGGGARNYYARLSSVYESAGTVNIVDGNPATTFSGAQVMVDATGRAQDELRRIQVRVPLTGGQAPVNAVQSGGAICKHFGIVPPPSGTGYPSNASSFSATNLCT